MINRRPNESASIDVTVVLPAHNEEGNILPLMDQFGELARKARFTLEVVLVDDGSTDLTLPRAVEAQNQHRFLRIVAQAHRRGLTEALRAGFSVARGQIIVFYPADRQFHPADIPRMVEKVRSGYDLVTGRKIGFYNKKFVSSFYNRLSRWLFPSIKVSDLNSVKAFRRELIDVFDYRHDWHRFWVAIVAEAGYRIGEVDVTLYQRGSGRSKFGFWRIPGGVLDLLAVKFQYHTMRRPLWYFGITGLFLLAAGAVVGGVALYQRFVEGHGYRPLVYLVMTLGMAGAVFFAIGFLAEAVAGLRQQLDTLRPSPKHHVYKPGGPETAGPMRSQTERPDTRPARPEKSERPARREGAPDARRSQTRPDKPRQERSGRRDEGRHPDRPTSPAPLQAPVPPIVTEDPPTEHPQLSFESVPTPPIAPEAISPAERTSEPPREEPADRSEAENVAQPKLNDSDGHEPPSQSDTPETTPEPKATVPPTNLYGRRKRT